MDQKSKDIHSMLQEEEYRFLKLLFLGINVDKLNVLFS